MSISLSFITFLMNLPAAPFAVSTVGSKTSPFLGPAFTKLSNSLLAAKRPKALGSSLFIVFNAMLAYSLAFFWASRDNAT